MIPPRVLVIDDEPDMLENCHRLLGRAGFDVRTLSDPRRVREAMSEFQPDVLLLDLRMPAADGMAVLPAALAADAELPVIIMTAYASVASAVAAIREGAFDYLQKPFTGDQLTVTVSRAVRYRGLTLENRRLREQAGSTGESALVGNSAPLARLVSEVRRVAPTEANVLITGESGTGKELIARRLHGGSPRRGGPFVPIDCAALPGTLLESELFGHERGAFTGAITQKRGLLVEGTGGTVFLDEVGELELGVQAKLLRTLEERQVRPVGGTRLMATDIRVIAATNVDLEAAVEAGRFRPDLYFRLNVVRLHVPPLRARPGDVPLLMEHFLEHSASTAGRPVPRVSPEAWAALERYGWPGNVRELRNLAQRLAILDADGRVTLADLPEAVRGWADSPSAEAAPSPYAPALQRATREFRRVYVTRLLEHWGGNVSRAAAAAGVSRRTLHRWMAELGEP